MTRTASTWLFGPGASEPCAGAPARPPLPPCEPSVAAISRRDLRLTDIGEVRAIYGYLGTGLKLHRDDPVADRDCMFSAYPEGDPRHGPLRDLFDCSNDMYARLGLESVEVPPSSAAPAERNDVIFTGDAALVEFLCTGDESRLCCAIPNVGDLVVATGVVEGPAARYSPAASWNLRVSSVCVLPRGEPPPPTVIRPANGVQADLGKPGFGWMPPRNQYDYCQYDPVDLWGHRPMIPGTPIPSAPWTPLDPPPQKKH